MPTIHDIDPFSAVRVTTAESEEYFNSLTFTKADAKMSKTMLVTMCTNCHKKDKDLQDGENMKKCSRCKGAWYCSRECQKQHWSKHKPICHPVEGSGIHSLVQFIATNPYLSMNLQLYACLAFDLASMPRSNDRLKLLVDLGIEPADIRYFISILQRMPDPGKKIEGMVQINDIQTVPGSMWKAEEVQLWKRAQEQHPRHQHHVLFEFHRSGGPPSTWFFAQPIHEEVIALARKKTTTVRLSAIEKEQVPMDERYTIEALNLLIRGDRENKFKLRVDMARFDMQAIHGVAEHDANIDPIAIEMLKVKMKREKVYQPILALLDSTST